MTLNLRGPILLAGLIGLSGVQAQAAKWQNFSNAKNVEDRRGEMASFAKEVDQLHDKFITYGNQASKRAHIFGCPLIDRTIQPARQAGERAKKAKPLATLLLGAEELEVGRADNSNVNACEGAARAQLDVMNRSISDMRARLEKFKGQENPIREPADDIREILKKTPVSASDVKCRVPTRQAYLDYDRYMDLTAQLHNMLVGQIKYLNFMIVEAQGRLASCGDKSYAVQKPPGWGKEYFRSRQESSNPKLDTKDLEGTFEGRHVK